MNIMNIFFMLALLVVPFYFSSMARWQVMGYFVGVGLHLLNAFVLGSPLLLAITLLVLLISCIQVIVENFPIRL